MFLNTKRANTLRVSHKKKKSIYFKTTPHKSLIWTMRPKMNLCLPFQPFCNQIATRSHALSSRVAYLANKEQLRMHAEAWSRELWPPPMVVARPFNSHLGERSIRGKRSSTRANGERRRSNTLAYVRTYVNVHVFTAGSFIKAELPEVRAAPLTWSSWQRAFSFINESAYYARRLRFPRESLPRNSDIDGRRFVNKKIERSIREAWKYCRGTTVCYVKRVRGAHCRCSCTYGKFKHTKMPRNVQGLKVISV